MMKFLSWPLIFVAILAGCGDANNNSDVPFSDDPFSTPDPDGSSYVAQLGYRDVRDTSRYLATAGYMDLYFGIDTTVGSLIREAYEAEANTAYRCPQGGSVIVTLINPPESLIVFNAVFSDCGVTDRLLSGSMSRTGKPIVMGFGDGELINTEIYSTAGVVRGECELPENDIGHYTLLNINTASVGQADIAGTVAITDSTYERRSLRSYDATSDESTCPVSYALVEIGDTTVNLTGYGPTGINGSAEISTSVDLDDENNSRVGIQSTNFSDESSVVISVLAEEDDRVQVDVISDGVGLSFEDNYRFTVTDFVLAF